MKYWKQCLILFLPVCLIIYGISFGPALRSFLKGDLSKRKLDAIYRPFLLPGLPRRIILPYARLWSSYGVPFLSWKAPYTEDEVRTFLQPGVSREAILRRFGQPQFDQREPEGSSNSGNETLRYSFLTTKGYGTYGEAVFGGFHVNLKDGKMVDWAPISVTAASPME